MINVRHPILVSSVFFLVFISSSLLFATPSFAARVTHSLVHEEVTKIPEYTEPEEPEIPEEPELPSPEEPEIPEVPEIPEEPEVPGEPEVPEEPEEPEGPKFGFPSWIPSFPFPGVNGGLPKTENTKPTSTAEEVNGSNKKP